MFRGRVLSLSCIPTALIAFSGYVLVERVFATQRVVGQLSASDKIVDE